MHLDSRDFIWESWTQRIWLVRRWLWRILKNNLAVEGKLGQFEAAYLFDSIKDSKNLQELQLNFSLGVGPTIFWTNPIYLLTPLSRENVQVGWKEKMHLPKLQKITIGEDDIKTLPDGPSVIYCSQV